MSMTTANDSDLEACALLYKKVQMPQTFILGHFYLQKKNYTGLQEFHKYSWAYGALPLDGWKEMGNIPQCSIAPSVDSLTCTKHNHEIMQTLLRWLEKVAGPKWQCDSKLKMVFILKLRSVYL